MILNKRSRRSSEERSDPGRPRKQSRGNSQVRSQASDISQELDLDEQNLIMNNESSRNSKGRKPKISSFSKASKKDLLKKAKKERSMSNYSGDLSMEEESFPSQFGKPKKEKKTNVISQEEVDQIYSKLMAQQESRKHTTKRNWTEEESKLLTWAIHTYAEKKGIKGENFTSPDWQNVAKFVPGRNETQCQYKFNQGHKSTITKTQWQKKEDDMLFKIIASQGTRQWNEIADTLNQKLNTNRNGKQCRERWYNFLNPEINREPFTPEEDLKILEKRQQIGNRWSEIVKILPGRTENSVKNRFNCLYKKMKEENLEIKKNTNIQEALDKIEGEPDEENLNEDDLIKELIQRKRQEVKETSPQHEQEEESKATPGADIAMNGTQESFKSNTNQMEQSLTPKNRDHYQEFIKLQSPNLFQQQAPSPNITQINYILNQLAKSNPKNINMIKNLSSLMEKEIRTSHLMRDINNTFKFDNISNYNNQQQQLMDISSSKISPNLGLHVKHADPSNGGLLVTQTRNRRSYSMVSSIDKLNRKFKNNLVMDEKKFGDNNDSEGNSKKSDFGSPFTNLLDFPNKTSSKTFVEEKTKEVLILASDGCYTYLTNELGQTSLIKLNDPRDILTIQPSPKILAGQSAMGTPTTTYAGSTQAKKQKPSIPASGGGLPAFQQNQMQMGGINALFRPITQKYQSSQSLVNLHQPVQQMQKSAFSKVTPPEFQKARFSPTSFLMASQNNLFQNPFPSGFIEAEQPSMNLDYYQQLNQIPLNSAGNFDARYLMLCPRDALYPQTLTPSTLNKHVSPQMLSTDQNMEFKAQSLANLYSQGQQ